MQDYHGLLVWKKSFDFVKDVYRVSGDFPKSEVWGMTSQLRRAVVSVCANIAEGRGKPTDKDFIRFLYISKGSLNECQMYVELAVALDFITEDVGNELQKKKGELGFLLYRFIDSLERPQRIKMRSK